MSTCPCGMEKTYAECCGAFIAGNDIPVTPEELMRSRYTAYTLANIDYIASTMKSPAADNFNIESATQFAKGVEWLKLEVIRTETQKSKGFVEFIAHFKQNNKHHALHELSEFHLVDDKWFYVNGIGPREIPASIKNRKTASIGRNDPCPCGSGKKFKKCCGKV